MYPRKTPPFCLQSWVSKDPYGPRRRRGHPRTHCSSTCRATTDIETKGESTPTFVTPATPSPDNPSPSPGPQDQFSITFYQPLTSLSVSIRRPLDLQFPLGSSGPPRVEHVRLDEREGGESQLCRYLLRHKRLEEKEDRQ